MGTNGGRIFISHKHDDAAIAQAFGEFIRTQSGNRIQAHISSSSSFESPMGGRPLQDQLVASLSNSGCLILIYTRPDDNWSYCMYECGFATREGIPVHIFQCGDSEPPPLSHLVRYKTTILDDVKRFVSAFLTQPDFLRGQRDALTNYGKNDDQVQKAAADFFASLQGAIARTDGTKQEWIPWPLIRLRVDRKSIEAISGSPSSEEHKIIAMKSLLEQKAVVSSVTPGFTHFIGLSVSIGESFANVRESWLKVYHRRENEVLYRTICVQMLAAFEKQIIPLQATYAKSYLGRCVLPVVSRTLSSVNSEVEEFDIMFYEIVDDPEEEGLITEKKDELLIQIPQVPAARCSSFPAGTTINGLRSSCLNSIFGVGQKDWQWDNFCFQIMERAARGPGAGGDVGTLFEQLPDLVFDSIRYRSPQPIFSVLRSIENGRQYQPVIERIVVFNNEVEVRIKFVLCSVPDIRGIKNSPIRRLMTALTLANRFRWEIIEVFGDEDEMSAAIGEIGGDVDKLLGQILERMNYMEKEALERGVYDRENLPLDFGSRGSPEYSRVYYMFDYWERVRKELEAAIKAGDVHTVSEKMRGMKPINREFVGLALRALESKV